jgi:hypothetical protein
VPSPHALSPEIRVNTQTTGNQTFSSITELADGAFVVTWHEWEAGSSYKVYGQTFSASGQHTGDAFLVATLSQVMAEKNAQVTALSDGRFVVTWTGTGAGLSEDMFARVFNANGSPAGIELEVAGSSKHEYAPGVIALDNGRFLVTWTQDESQLDTNAYGRIYDGNGPTGDAFRLNGATPSGGNQDYQFGPTSTLLSNGQFVVVWEDWADRSAIVIRGQLFNADGSKVGGQWLLSPSAAASGRSAQVDPTVTALSGGGFVVTYSDSRSDGTPIYGQIFNNAGTQIADEFQVSPTGLKASEATTAALNGGGFVATWRSPQNGSDDVLAQIFSANGVKVGTEFVVNGTISGDQGNSSVTVLSDGRIAVSWQGNGVGDDTGVFVRLFSADSFAPDVTPGVGGSFVEDGGAVTVAPQLTLSDIDSSTLTQATVKITQGLNAQQDELRLVSNPATGNITASFESVTGTLTLTSVGGSTMAQWQAALRAVVYDNSSQNPSTTQRVITITVSDAQGAGAPATTTVTVQALNDAPVLATSAGSSEFVEGNNVAGTPVAVDPGIVLSDVDSSRFSQALISITGGFEAGEDVLLLNGSFGNIQSAYDTATGRLSLTSANATATTAQWQAALRAVEYSNSSDTPSAVGRTVEFQIQDSAGAASAAVSRTLTVTPTNDTPVVAQAIDDQDATQGVAFSFTVPAGAFTDSDVGDTLSYSATRADGNPLPAWLNFDVGTGVFSGTPGSGDGGTLAIRVTATDGSGATVSDDFTLTVAIVVTVNGAPVLRNIPADFQSVTVGVASMLPAITVWDPDGDYAPLTLTLKASHARIEGGVDADPASPGFQLSGTATQINTALTSVSFTAWAAGSSAISFSLSDGIAPAPTTGTLALSAGVAPGAAGIDRVSHVGLRADYVLALDAEGVWTARPVAGCPATRLPGIDRVQFEDGVVALNPQAGGAAGQAARLVFSLWGATGVQNPELMGGAVAYVDAMGAQGLIQTAQSLGLLAAVAGGSEPADFLTLLHTNLLGRAPDAAELQDLLDFQTAGAHSLAQLLSIAASLPQVSEALAPLHSSGLPLTLYEGVLLGSGNDDVFRAQQGDAHINADAGLDTVVYGAEAALYTLARDEAGHWLVHSSAQDGGQDRLLGVERLQFADHAVALDLDGAVGQAVRILAAAKGSEVLADRALVGGLIAYVDAHGARGLAEGLQTHGVLDSLSGGDSLEALVTLLYGHVAGRPPSAAELQWTQVLVEEQQWDHADLLLYVAELPQTAELIGLNALAAQGVAYDPWLG